MSVLNGETCSRVRAGIEGKAKDPDARTVYLYDFNDDGMGGTEDHPYFTITSGEAGLFEAGEVYARIEIETKSGLASSDTSEVLDAAETVLGAVADDAPVVEGNTIGSPEEPVLGSVADEAPAATPKRSHSRKAK